MSWADFDTDSALERDLLVRALPLVPTRSDGLTNAVVDLATNNVVVAVHASDTLGATPDKCIELLRIRPLLVGAAWKVIDLLLETALGETGMSPTGGRRWTIDEKARHAGNAAGRPAAISQGAWSALMSTYSETVEIRHTLVHRTAHTDATNALVGVDSLGNSVRPLSSEEQEALVRAALRAAELVTSAHPDPRVEADLVRQLGALSGVHGIPLPRVTMRESLPEIIYITDPDPEAAGRYRLDLPRLRVRQPFQGATHADLTVRFRDRPGQEAKGRLENAPDSEQSIDPDTLPTWLT